MHLIIKDAEKALESINGAIGVLKRAGGEGKIQPEIQIREECMKGRIRYLPYG